MHFLKKFINNKALLAVIMAIFTYYRICIYESVRIYDLLSWLIFFSLIILYLKTDLFNKKMKKEIIFLSVLFAFLFVLGSLAYNLKNAVDISVYRSLLTFESLLNFIGVFNLIFIILTNLVRWLCEVKCIKEKQIAKKPWVIFIFCLILFLIAWLPYFLSLFPGSLTPDSFGELEIIINNFTKVTDHHPVIHILFIAGPFNIGYKLFGSLTLGIALSSITQMIVLAAMFSSLITFLYKRKVNYFILLIIILYYALLPMHGYYSVTMWKDVLFSGFLLLLSMQLVKIIEKENEGNLNYKNILGFIAISIFCIFFRNNAVYMFVILFIVTLFIFKKYYKLFLGVFGLIFAIYIIIKGPVFSYFHITKSASAEYIGMPLQQVGRMAFKNVQFTEEEKQLINKLIPVDIMASAYNPIVSDGIKFNENYNGKAFDDNKMTYFSLWLKLVLKHPSVALESYTISTLGYWYPGVEYWSVASDVWDNNYGLYKSPKAPDAIIEYIKDIESRYKPIINIEWSIGLCFWIILIFSFIAFKKKGLYGIYPFVPIAGVWITMMIASPVFAEFRYVYGAFTSLPLLLLCPYLDIQKTNKRKKNNYA